MTQINKLSWKLRLFLPRINSQAAAFLMLQARPWQSKARKDSLISHGRLAFFSQLQRFYLPLLVGLDGSTDSTSRKSAMEEKMGWKVTLPSALLFFFCKRYLHNQLHFFTFICIWNRLRSVSFSDSGSLDRDIIFRYRAYRVFCFLGCVWSLMHVKLTAGGEALARILTWQ